LKNKLKRLIMKYGNEEIRRRKNKKDKIKNVLYIIVHIILVPILIYNTFLIIQSLVKPNETPSFLGIKTYVIISGSMEPEIQIGDIVITKEVDIEELNLGDIISYRKGESVITHRITKIEKEDEKIVITTKGDSNNAEDTYEITEGNIEGRVIKVIPSIGNISLLLQNKIIIILILLIAFLIYSRNEKVQKRKNVRRLKRLEYEENLKK